MKGVPWSADPSPDPAPDPHGGPPGTAGPDKGDQRAKGGRGVHPVGKGRNMRPGWGGGGAAAWEDDGGNGKPLIIKSRKN